MPAPYTVSDALPARQEVRAALRARDFRSVFLLLLGLAPRPWEDGTAVPAGGGRAPAGAGGPAATLGTAESGHRAGGAGQDRSPGLVDLDTPTMATLACQLLPALQPGESTTVRYTCRGGRFEEVYYWRECPRRPTRCPTIRIRHRGARRLASCTAVEERADGSEISATDSLSCRYDDGDILLEVTRENLAPNQAVELRWDVTGEPAR